MPSASVEAKLSVRIAWGMCLRSPCFTSADHIAPDEPIAITEDTSYWPGASSSARNNGLPNGSPTIAICETLCVSTADQIAWGSSDALSTVTTQPPLINVDIVPKKPVPCICGQAGR